MTDPPIDYGQYDEGAGLNYWDLEPALARELRRVYPADEYDWAEPILEEYGGTVGETIAPRSDRVDDDGPDLQTYDRHGNLLNAVHYHPDHLENERVTFESGMVADAFRAPPERDEPVGLQHTLAMQTLACYADVGLICEVSMTAGSALVLRNHDEAGYYEEVFRELTTREYDSLSQGGMFLTEEQGGSDVGANETVAEPVATGPAGEAIDAATAAPDGAIPDSRAYELTGEKWFCSNIDAQGILALASRPDAPDGTDGLSLFWVPHELPDGDLNPQIYRRLKDKLGTESVATGEVEFADTIGYLVGEPERGFKYMTTMLNWERVTNATGAVGVMGRALLESKIHAANREAFGQPIGEFPLMRRDLVDMQVDFEAALSFSFEASKHFDRYERDHDDETAYALMRALVPVAKHRTGRMAIDTTSYAIEVLGGNGYVGDFVTERLLRDAQVLPIWEGTSNILSLDLLRAFATTDAVEAVVTLVDEYLDELTHPALSDLVATVREHHETLQDAIGAVAAGDQDDAEYVAKELADLLFDVVTAAVMLAKAQRRLDRADDAREATVAAWFVRETLESPDDRGILEDEALTPALVDAVLRYDRLEPADFAA